jgi:single-strand DNA-binding protein
MNSVALIGRLTADPASHAGEKHESATFRLAVPAPGTDGADFVAIATFDKLAAICGEYLTKDREVAVVGRLHLNECTSRDGEGRSKIQSWPMPSSSSTPPKKTADPVGAVPEPADKPAVGAYRRKAS